MNDALMRAKVRMILKFPFFAVLTLKHTFTEDTSVKTMKVDGDKVIYNPEFFGSLNLDEQVGALAQVVTHTALKHHTRMGSRNPKKWNLACDYATNVILKESGVTLLPDAPIEMSYKGMSAEDIYAMLPQDNDGDPDWEPGDGFAGGMGDVSPFPNPEKRDLEEQQQDMNLLEAHTAAKAQGNVPAAINRLVEEILNPKTPWHVYLSRIMAEKARNDYSWTKPNRNYIQRGLYVPGLLNFEPGDIVIAVDTSGSISQNDLNVVAGHINEITDIVSNRTVVIYCDAHINAVEIFEPGDEIILRAVGGGGTDFRPPFQYITKEAIQPKLFIYFTDGECNSFPQEPDYDVMWLCSNRHMNAPFGQIVYYEPE